MMKLCLAWLTGAWVIPRVACFLPFEALEEAFDKAEPQIRQLAEHTLASLQPDEVDQLRELNAEDKKAKTEKIKSKIIAEDTRRERKQTRNSICAFSVLQAANFFARSAFQIRNMVKS